MEPLSALTGFLASFLATALYESAKEHDDGWRVGAQDELDSLRKALHFRRSHREHIDAAVAEAFRTLAPIEAYNQFGLLFGDLEFRQGLLRWMFALEGEEREKALANLKRRANRRLPVPHAGEQAVDVVTQAFEGVVVSHDLLARVMARKDRERILEAVQETAHRIDLQMEDASRRLDDVLARIEAAERKVDEDAAEVVGEFALYTDSVVSQQVELPVIGLIDRVESSQALASALEMGDALLLGEAGTGKTGIMVRLARELRARGECVLFLGADSLRRQFAGTCTVADLSKALGFHEPLPDLIAVAAGSHGRVWVLVDQIDAVASEPVGAAFVQLLHRLRGRENCRTVLACRSYEAEYSAQISAISFPKIYVSDLAPEEVSRSLERLGLSATRELVVFCGNLLNLSLLATLVDKGAPVSDLTAQGELWNALREYLAQPERPGLLDFVCDGAVTAISRPGGRFYSKDRVRADWLSSSGILVREPSGQYRFRHEKLRDYFVAYDSVVRRAEPLSDLMDRIPVVRSKTVFPWMLQIAATAAPDHCARLLVEVFDDSLVRSNFPRKACIDSLSLISHPTEGVVRAVWQAAVARSDKAYELLAPCGESGEWAMAFWSAGLFDSAAHADAGAEEEAARKLLAHLPTVAQQVPEAVLRWIVARAKSGGATTGVVAALVECPDSMIPAALEGVLPWMEQDEGLRDGPLHTLIERAAQAEQTDLAVRLFRCATHPVWWRSPADPTFRGVRCGELLMQVRHLEEEERDGRLLGVPFNRLVPVFREHVSTLKRLAAENSEDRWCDPYACWGQLRGLFSPGRKDQGDEWELWYGLLRGAALGASSENPRVRPEIAEELLGSPDLLEARIGLELLGTSRRYPAGLVETARVRGLLREPAAIGESVRLLAQLIRSRRRNRDDEAAALAAEICAAIDALDRDRPKFLAMGLDIPRNEIRWARKLAFNAGADDDASLTKVSRFVTALETRSFKGRPMSFAELTAYCEMCLEAGIRPCGWRSDMGGRRYVDAVPEFASLHECAVRLRDAVVSGFDPIYDAARRERSDWASGPVGYVLLHAAQWKIDSHAQSLRRKNRNAQRTGNATGGARRERIPWHDMLGRYMCAIEAATKWAPAVRAQYAGLLAMLCSELPLEELKEGQDDLRFALRRLATCRDAGCVQSWCRQLNDLEHEPLSVGSVASFGLLELAWRLRFDRTNPEDELVHRVFHPPGDDDAGRRADAAILVAEDRTAIESALREGAQANVVRALGRSFAKLALLDSAFTESFLDHLAKSDLRLSNLLMEELARASWLWLCYPSLRPLYERVVAEDEGVFPLGCVEHVACAFLVGLEDREDKEGVLGHLLRFSGQNKERVLESVCDAYDWLGRSPTHWQKVRALWSDEAERARSAEVGQPGAFWRCFEEGRRSIYGKNEHVKPHSPESVSSLAPLLEATCDALGRGATYSARNKRDAVIAYLADQSVGHETVCVRLLALLVGMESGNYDHIRVDYSEGARIVLRNAIVSGGEAREIAASIIDRHELSGGSSLAGLLL